MVAVPTVVCHTEHMLTPRQREVLAIIERDPLVTQAQLAAELGITRSAVAGHVRQLTALGVVRGRGYLLNEPDYVCVVGGANIDIEGRAPTSLQYGDSTIGTVHKSPGGVARNVAENLARLGLATRLITARGLDRDGDWLHDETSKAGVDMADTLVCPGYDTARYVAIVAHNGELTAGINDMGILDQLSPQALDERRATIAHAAVLVTDCNLGEASLQHLPTLAPQTPLFVDPVSTAKAGRVIPLLASIHTIKPNRAEAAILTDTSISDEASLRKAAAKLLEHGIQQVVVSLGRDGLYYAAPSTSGFLRPPRRTAASVIGAGDALMAGLVWGYLRGLPLRDAAEFGLAAAALAASSPRTVAPEMTPDNVQDLLQEAAS